ncbi:MAG: ADP-ribosylglycohydrolase family protein [Polyangiales bacterium]
MWWKRAQEVRPEFEPTRLYGCLYGGALGDALGFQFESRGPPDGDALDCLGCISDDTQLTLATLEAIASRARVDPELIAQAFVDWNRRDGIRGAGASTTKAIRELHFGAHWALVGRKGEMAAGNGAAIRIAPLAFALDPATRIGRLRIRDVARITHHSDEAYVGALALCLAIHDVLHNRPLSLTAVASRLSDTRVRDRLQLLSRWDGTLEDAAAELGTSGYVVESVPLAIWAAARAEEGDYSTLIQSLVRLGGDCDSIASMAGQLFGARFGAGAMPKTWMLQLRERAKVDHAAALFLNRI